MNDSDRRWPPSSRIPWWLIGAFVAGAATLLLWQEHRSHLLAALSWLLLLGCPLVHLFMHRRHGRHEANQGSSNHHAQHGTSHH